MNLNTMESGEVFVIIVKAPNVEDVFFHYIARDFNEGVSIALNHLANCANEVLEASEPLH